MEGFSQSRLKGAFNLKEIQEVLSLKWRHDMLIL